MTDNVINECSICLEPLDTTQETCLLTCEHQFHLACCQNWFSQPTNTKHSCALCNKEYVEIELIFNTIPVEKSKNKTKNKTKNVKHPKQSDMDIDETELKIYLPCYTQDEAENQLQQLVDLYTNTLKEILSKTENGFNPEEKKEIIETFQSITRELLDLDLTFE